MILNVQSFRCFDRAAFGRFLAFLRKHAIRAVKVKAVNNEYGHVRTYRIVGRDNAHWAYQLAFEAGLLEWFS